MSADAEDDCGQRCDEHSWDESSGEASPLRVAEGATVIDSTGRSVDDVVDEIVAVTGR